MLTMPKLTDTHVRKLPFSPTRTTKYWDPEIRGFCLFVGKRTKTWYYQRDVAGRTKRVLIGRYPMIGAVAARETAQGLALEMGRGLGKKAQRGAPRLEDALATYLARPKLRCDFTKEQMPRQFQLHIADWMRLPLTEITPAMCVERHSTLANIPSGANHLLRAFRAIWNHARRTHDLPEAPTRAIEWYPDLPDGRLIDDLPAWRATVEALPNPIHATFYRLLLFTGLRRSEAFALRWENVHNNRLHIPITKNGRPFDLPILPLHHDILAPMRTLKQPWVFPGTGIGAGPLKSPRRIGWSPHAHRRTFATVALEAGVFEEYVGRLLNHTPPTITGQRYARPRLDALREHMATACEALSRRISSGERLQYGEP